MEQENKNMLEEVEQEQPQEETAEETVEEVYEGKQVTTSIKYDYRTMKYFNMYNTVIRRKMPMWYFGMGIAAIAFAVYTLISGINAAKADPDASMTSTYIFTGIFVFLGIYLAMQGLKFEGLVDRTIANHFMTHKVAKQHIRIREDIITLIPVNKPEESFSYDWIQVTNIEEINEFFFLYIGRSPLIIDKNPENMIEGTYEEMVEIIKEKAEMKPYKRYSKPVVKKPITFVHFEDLEENSTEVEAEEVETQEEE